MPGAISTGLQRHMSREELRDRGWVDDNGEAASWWKEPQQGARDACSGRPSPLNWTAWEGNISRTARLLCRGLEATRDSLVSTYRTR